MKKTFLLTLTISFFSFYSCTQEKKSINEAPKTAPLVLSPDFGDYWYQGKAEITTYALEQVRYSQSRNGNATLIFVTEDFSRSKQVKLDNPQTNRDDIQKVMKLNFTKKFETGVYPYSIMSSAFSPVYPKNDLHAVKITTSVQEWCGHVFMQLNKSDKQYKVLERSYFESEGDQNFELPKTWVEDELWNLLRLNPEAIPDGNVQIIPSSRFLRLKHVETKAFEATIEHSTNDSSAQLTVEYPDLKRTLSIYYESEFPHQINSWEETYPEGGKQMTTKATLRKRILLDYWNRNNVADSTYRKDLGLE